MLSKLAEAVLDRASIIEANLGKRIIINKIDAKLGPNAIKNYRYIKSS